MDYLDKISVLAILILIAIFYKVRIMGSKLDTLIKSNDQLRRLISEQSEVIRAVKVKSFGIEQVRDLPPGTKLEDIKLK